MLVEFSVRNFLSVRDKVTLSMVAADTTMHSGNAFDVPGLPGVQLLRTAAIYGANASGKSNLLKALRFMRSFVLRSTREDNGMVATPFRLSSECVSQPSEFEVIFVTEGTRYVYGFQLEGDVVCEEWLDAATIGRRTRSRPLFCRSTEDGVVFGSSWRGDREKLKQLTRANALLLSVASEFNIDIIKPVMRWFRRGLMSISDVPEKGGEMQFTVERLEKAPEFTHHLEHFLHAADLGIKRVEIEGTDLTPEEFIDQMSEGGNRALAEVFVEAARKKMSEAAFRKVHIQSFHDVDGSFEVAFDLERQESAGTKRMFALSGPWFQMLLRGHVLLVDELDSKLHPLLTRFLIETTHDSRTTAQLIFTTHDSSLLDPEILRRDQIWFTEKDTAGATRLYSLHEYHPRPNENYRASYLKGRYGAIPFIGELRFEQARPSEEA